MKRSIEITVSPIGEILIDAVGFIGADCERATKFLEKALGVPGKKVKKREFLQRTVNHGQQKVGH